ncbi:MAG: hypothetical protein WEB60_00125, partial [Terrimicrobiaceae bacterium]
SYEKFLNKIAEQILKPLQKGTGADTPEELNTPGKRALYNNLTLPTGDGDIAIIHEVDENPRLRCVLNIDWTVRNARQDNWRGNTAKEEIIKAALYRVLDFDENEVERIFPIILAQTEY